MSVKRAPLISCGVFRAVVTRDKPSTFFPSAAAAGRVPKFVAAKMEDWFFMSLLTSSLSFFLARARTDPPEARAFVQSYAAPRHRFVVPSSAERGERWR